MKCAFAEEYKRISLRKRTASRNKAFVEIQDQSRTNVKIVNTEINNSDENSRPQELGL